MIRQKWMKKGLHMLITLKLRRFRKKELKKIRMITKLDPRDSCPGLHFKSDFPI